jgi:hypothetical protein
MITDEQAARFRELANSVIASVAMEFPQPSLGGDPQRVADAVRVFVEYALTVPGCVPDSVRELQDPRAAAVANLGQAIANKLKEIGDRATWKLAEPNTQGE